MATGRRWVPLAVGVMLAGCGQNAFHCADDAACGGAEARCEPSGFCSFPDPSCESGRAYGRFAGSLSGECLPPPDAANGSTSSASGAGDSTSEGTNTISGSTSDQTSTTSDVSVTAGQTTAVESSSGGSGSSTGTDHGPALCDSTAVVEEEFSLLPLSEEVWATEELGEVEASVPGGVLNIAVSLPDVDSPPAYWTARAQDGIPLIGSIGLEVHVVPASDAPAEIMVGIEDASRYLFLDVLDDGIYALIREPDETFTILEYIVFDPVAHRWIRLTWSAEAETVDFETSPDRAIWTTFHTLDAPGFDFSTASFVIAGGAWEGPLTKDPLVAFDNAFMCDLG